MYILKGLVKISLVCFVFLGAHITSAQGQIPAAKEGDQLTWSKISSYFTPPSELKDQLGTFRSPLKFYSGKEVKSVSDWEKRRKEIKARWHSLMGEWPPLLTDQKMQIMDTVQKEGFTQHRVRFNWTPNEVTEGYLSIPDGKGKKPAVITVFYEPETAVTPGKLDRDFAYQLTKRGFVTLSIGTKEASLAKTFSIYYPNIEKTKIQPLSALGYAAANAWHVLSKVPDVDASKIGIMGHSFGGKWAMFASCLFDKFACAVWSDPGIVFSKTRESVNYWEPWYLGYHPKPWRKRGVITDDNPGQGLYLKLVADGYDLHELHALMAPRPFLVSGGSEDPVEQWIPLNHTIKVNKLLGYENRVAMTNRPLHSPNPESNEVAFSFLEYFLNKKKEGK